MSKQEILTKAIELAIAGGYVPVTGERQDDLSIEWLAKEYCDNSDGYTLFSLIYDKEFAKCLWGEAPIAHTKTMPPKILYSITDWRYHLQQMVIADDPIAYLGEHLPS